MNDSKTIDDGGPAFPGNLRDWFAGQALAGMMASEASSEIGDGITCYVADVCYEYADAMIEARKADQP